MDSLDAVPVVCSVCFLFASPRRERSRGEVLQYDLMPHDSRDFFDTEHQKFQSLRRCYKQIIHTKAPLQTNSKYKNQKRQSTQHRRVDDERHHIFIALGRDRSKFVFSCRAIVIDTEGSLDKALSLPGSEIPFDSSRQDFGVRSIRARFRYVFNTYIEIHS